MIEPYAPFGKLATEQKDTPFGKVFEPTTEAIDSFLYKAPQLQSALGTIPVDDRLDVFDRLGRLWFERLNAGAFEHLRDEMARGTGYSTALLDTEMTFITAVLSHSNLERNIMATLLGGTSALERFIEVEETEHYLHRPAGPSLIVASGNSIVPVLIPTVLSLVTGNVTFLKPSLANFSGVRQVLSLLDDLPQTAARDAIRNALAIAYLRSDGPVLDHALGRASFGVVNFWGGEPARTLVAQKVATNPNRPRFFANGPMTGVAIIHTDSATEDAADGLAMNVVLYDQQLCSSPTMALFVGELAQAQEFAKKVAEHLDEIGGTQPMKLGEGGLFALQNFRRTLQMKGAAVYNGRTQENSWTLALCKGRSMMDDALVQYPHMGLHNRRRFLELVTVPNLDEAVSMVRQLPRLKAYSGIDRVQTVGLAIPDAMEQQAAMALAGAGAYRILPVGDMYMRSAIEPYDGVLLASLFTYTVYRRSRNISLEEQL